MFYTEISSGQFEIYKKNGNGSLLTPKPKDQKEIANIKVGKYFGLIDASDPQSTILNCKITKVEEKKVNENLTFIEYGFVISW